MSSQRCPVCKTPLWTDPFLTPSRLRCPRCGTEFKPTVPWQYVRILFIAVVALAILVVALLTQGNLLWIVSLLVVGALAACLWYLSRLIDLQKIGPELTPEEGVLDSKQMKLQLETRHIDEKKVEQEERRRFRRTLWVLATLCLLMITVVIWWTVS